VILATLKIICLEKSLASLDFVASELVLLICELTNFSGDVKNNLQHMDYYKISKFLCDTELSNCLLVLIVQ
jgi:hypothetical protein